MEQLNIFSYILPQYKITKPIRLIELFAGIGSQAKALKNLGVNFEHYRVVEWDKYAINSYNSVHGTTFTTSDIAKIKGSDLGIVDTRLYDYILTYSFPCQDLSLAGKMGGMSKGTNTRSGLLWEVERLLDECTELPQILLMENVPQIISQQNIADFQDWQYKLEQLGYSNYVSLLNAKDYGIPQNRNRCFMVSILGDFYYGFPRKQKLKLRLKDMLEDEVNEKYYLSERTLKGVLNTTFECSKLENRLPKNDIIIHTCQGGNTESKVTIKEYANYITREDSKGRLNTQDHRAFMPERISGTVPAMERGVPKILIPEAIKQGYAIATEGDGVYINRPHQKRGVVQKCLIQTLKTNGNDVGVVVSGYSEKSIEKIINNITDIDGCSNTITANPQRATIDSATLVEQNLRIRKLTPKECWRLMGFSDEDFEKASKVNSNAQLYKQAGNSIVVNVLEAIFKELL